MLLIGNEFDDQGAEREREQIREDEWSFRRLRAPVLRALGQSFQKVYGCWCSWWRSFSFPFVVAFDSITLFSHLKEFWNWVVYFLFQISTIKWVHLNLKLSFCVYVCVFLCWVIIWNMRKGTVVFLLGFFYRFFFWIMGRVFSVFVGYWDWMFYLTFYCYLRY